MPELNTYRVDKQVSTVLQAYTNDGFIADVLFPKVSVSEESGVIGAIDNSHLRRFDSRRALYDESAHRVEFNYTNTDRYAIEYYDREIYLPDRVINQAEAPFNARRDASIVLLEGMKLERELVIAEFMTSTTNLTNNITLVGSDQFNDGANSRPEVVIQDAVSTARNACLRVPNHMIITWDTIQVLKRHPFFVNQYNGLSILSENAVVELLKTYFEVQNVHIAKARYVSSKDGQTETKANVWNNDIVLYYAPATPSLFAPSFGYSFELQGGLVSKTRRHERDKGDNVMVEHAYQDFVLDADSAFLIKDVIA